MNAPADVTVIKTAAETALAQAFAEARAQLPGGEAIAKERAAAFDVFAREGLPHRRVILRHALRNALIAPFTIIALQLNWILSGVVVVEVFFEYAGFGKLLLDAALFGDVYVIQAATLAAVFVAVTSQIISDVGYTFLNPRIRFS